MIVIFILIGLTTIILIAGVLIMAVGGKYNNKLKTKLMSFRVIFQGITLVVLVVLCFLIKLDYLN